MAVCKPPRNPRRWRGFWLVALLAAGAAAAAPYRPTDDAEVLARLPPRVAPVPAGVADASLAARAAQVYIERGRRSDDPRDYGYAQGLLQPWWTAADAPDAILVLRATLRQHQHDFDAALADLDRVLARSPGHAQARLTRATIHRVRGDLDASLQDCVQMAAVAPGFAAILCRLAVVAQRQPDVAAAELDALAPASARQPQALYAWYQAERAAAALRRGDNLTAETALRDGLARAGWDLGLRTTLADLLLDQQRAAEVPALLADAADSDALRLRLLLAQRALGQTEPAAALAATLVEAHAALQRRGDPPHRREQALMALHVDGDAVRALELARANWRDQRELADARLLLAAALAAADAGAIAGLRAWCAQLGVRDAWLEARW
jgi:hypothetical protein